MFSSSRTHVQFEGEDSDLEFAAFYGLNVGTYAAPTGPLIQPSYQVVADTTQPQSFNQLLSAATFSQASHRLAGNTTQPQDSFQPTTGNVQAEISHQLPNPTTPVRQTLGLSQELIIRLILKRTKPPEEEFRRRLEACTPRGQLFGFSSNSAPYMKPLVSARTTIADLPYDVIYTICNHIVELYPACPLDCSKGRSLNSITVQYEERLELNSTAIPRIIAFLNAGAAWADMENLVVARPELKSHVKASMESMRTITQRRRPLYIEQIWFEDLSWIMTSLNQFGCANISTVSLCWDNLERNTIITLAPPNHRTEYAPAKLFNNLRSKCQGLNTLHVTLALENLRTRKPNGNQRIPSTKDYQSIRGMDELKALVQAVRLKKGGGKVTIRLDVGDSRGFANGTPVHGWNYKGKEKTDLVSWLDDGEPIELKAIEDAVDLSGSRTHCRACDGDFCFCYADI